MLKAIFLDRDGVLNEDTMYAHKIEDFILLPGVVEGLQKLRDDGFVFFIVTNQSGIGRGKYTEEDMHTFNDHLLSILKDGGISIEKVYFCPHHPDDNCSCRKPNPTSAHLAEKEFSVDLSQSYILGDHKSDIDMGKNAGLRTVFLLTGHGTKDYNPSVEPDKIARNMIEAAEWIISQETLKETFKKIISIEKIGDVVASLKKQGRTIVTTTGSFDILHAGHIKLLEEAKNQGDVLIVGLNSDSSIKEYKSADRPINAEKERAEVLAALSYVDQVVVFSDTTPLKLIEAVSPDVYCNGEEYGKDCVEAPLLKKIGARLHLIKKFGDFSTTKLIEKMKS